MKVIIKRTLEETLRISAIILVIVAGIAGGYIVGKNLTFVEVPTYAEFTNKSLIMQHLVIFFLMNGAILMGIVSSVCSGLIAGIFPALKNMKRHIRSMKFSALC